MAIHVAAKKPKKSLAALRKKHEEDLLSMSDKELAASMNATLDRLAKILKKRS